MYNILIYIYIYMYIDTHTHMSLVPCLLCLHKVPVDRAVPEPWVCMASFLDCPDLKRRVTESPKRGQNANIEGGKETCLGPPSPDLALGFHDLEDPGRRESNMHVPDWNLQEWQSQWKITSQLATFGGDIQ